LTSVQYNELTTTASTARSHVGIFGNEKADAAANLG